MRGKINKSITNFENQPVRRVWDEGKEKWYFNREPRWTDLLEST